MKENEFFLNDPKSAVCEKQLQQVILQNLLHN